MPAIFLVVLFFRLLRLLVVANRDVRAANVNLSTRIGSIFDRVIAFFPRNELDVAASERAAGRA